MKPPKTECKFKVFGLKKCPQNFRKGIACGYRTQKVPRISPVQKIILTGFSFKRSDEACACNST